jgi:hypothetical protein
VVNDWLALLNVSQTFRVFPLNSQKITDLKFILFNNQSCSIGHHLLLRDYGPYMIIFINVCVVTAVATVRRSLAVKGILVLCDNWWTI